MVGDDEAGRSLLQIFRRAENFRERHLAIKGHTTTTKTRVLAYSAHSSRQQVVRIDREMRGAGRYASRADGDGELRA